MKLKYPVITLFPKALPLAKEPGFVSEPQLSVSEGGRQGSGQRVSLTGKGSSSFFKGKYESRDWQTELGVACWD